MLIKFLDGTEREFTNLRYADLSDANIANAALPNGFRIARLDFGEWQVTVTPTHTHIGSQSHKNALWLKANPRWIAALDKKATEWWARHGASVQTVIRDVMGE